MGKLHEAIITRNPASFEQLLARPDVNVDETDHNGRTPLMLAAVCNHVDIAFLCIEKKANMNAQNTEGMDALMHAAGEGNFMMVRFLISNGAAPNQKDSQKKTALDYAVSSGDSEIEKFLAEKQGLPFKDNAKRTREFIQRETYYGARPAHAVYSPRPELQPYGGASRSTVANTLFVRWTTNPAVPAPSYPGQMHSVPYRTKY